jgi:hypothetical protein
MGKIFASYSSNRGLTSDVWSRSSKILAECKKR